jgi:hypothetical protein
MFGSHRCDFLMRRGPLAQAEIYLSQRILPRNSIVIDTQLSP